MVERGTWRKVAWGGRSTEKLPLLLVVVLARRLPLAL